MEFLSGLGYKKSLNKVIPEEIRKFLIWKEQTGKRQNHSITCKFLGVEKLQECNCNIAMAAGSVSNLISLLKSIFNEQGLTQPWNEINKTGNPIVKCD